MTKFQDKIENILNEANKENKSTIRLIKILRKNGYEIIPGKEKDIIEFVNPNDVDPKELENFVMDLLTNSKEDIEPFVKKIEKATTPKEKPTEEKPTEVAEAKPAEVATPEVAPEKEASGELTDEELQKLINIVVDTENKHDIKPFLESAIDYSDKINKIIEKRLPDFISYLKNITPTSDKEIQLMSILYYVSSYGGTSLNNTRNASSINFRKFNDTRNATISSTGAVKLSLNSKKEDINDRNRYIISIATKAPEKNIESGAANTETIKDQIKNNETKTSTTSPENGTPSKAEPNKTEPEAKPSSDDSVSDISKASSLGEFEDAVSKATKEIGERYSKVKQATADAQKKAEDASIHPSQKDKIAKTAKQVNDIIIKINKEANEFSKTGVDIKLDGDSSVFQINKNVLKLTDNDFSSRTNIARKIIRQTVATFSNFNLDLDSAENQIKMFESIKTLQSSIKGTVDSIKGSSVWRNLQTSIPARALAGLSSVATNAIDRQTFYSYVTQFEKFKNTNWGENDQFKTKLYNIGINSFKIDDKKKRQEIQKKVFDIFKAMGDVAATSGYDKLKKELSTSPEGVAKYAKIEKLRGLNLTVG